MPPRQKSSTVWELCKAISTHGLRISYQPTSVATAARRELQAVRIYSCDQRRFPSQPRGRKSSGPMLISNSEGSTFKTMLFDTGRTDIPADLSVKPAISKLHCQGFFILNRLQSVETSSAQAWVSFWSRTVIRRVRGESRSTATNIVRRASRTSRSQQVIYGHVGITRW